MGELELAERELSACEEVTRRLDDEIWRLQKQNAKFRTALEKISDRWPLDASPASLRQFDLLGDLYAMGGHAREALDDEKEVGANEA